MGLFYSIHFFILLACAAGYYKAADIENVSPLLWSGMSVLTFLLTWRVFGWGIPGNLLGQAALLAGITLFRVIRDSRKEE